MTTLPRRAARDLRVLVGNPLAIGIAVLFFAGAATTLAFFPREGSVVAAANEPPPEASQDQRAQLESFLAGAPRVPLVVPREGAKVLIVKFNDFQCPACGQTYLQYKPILAKYEASNPGAVKMVLKDYPLQRECNDAIGQSIHPAACDAAVAVRLARLRNKGEAMEEWLYTHQSAMTPASVRHAAKDVGGVTDFEEKYASTLASVKSDVALGKQLGIRATPTFFVNGVRFDSAILPQYFDAAIAYELKNAK
jgi:protein-disulfide isomerase